MMVGYPKRMLTDQISQEVYNAFKKACKKHNVTPGHVLANFIEEIVSVEGMS